MSFCYTTPTFVLNHGERATRFTLQRFIYTNIPEEFMKIDLDCLDLCDWSCLGDFAKLSSLNCYTTTCFFNAKSGEIAALLRSYLVYEREPT